MLSFAAVLEPLRMVNRLRQTNLYEWQHFSPDDGPVPASNGIEFALKGARLEFPAKGARLEFPVAQLPCCPNPPKLGHICPKINP